MDGQHDLEHEKTLVDAIASVLKEGKEHLATSQLVGRSPGELALLLESLPPAERSWLWTALSPEMQANVLPHLHREVRALVLEEVAPDELITVAEAMDLDQVADVIRELPPNVTEALIESLADHDRRRLETTLSFAEGTAGRLMRTDLVTVRPDVCADTVLRYLRRRGVPSHTDGVLVADRDDKFLGKLSFSALLGASPRQLVGDLMDADAVWVGPDTSEKEVALLFERRDLVTVAVVDPEQKLLGRIRVVDVVNLIRAESEHVLMKRVGLEEGEDLFAPVLLSARRRALWLGINLMTVFLAAWVIGLFEATLDKVVALAILMPIVASMGGIAGSQTLTLMVRGLALDQIGKTTTRWLTMKELTIGALNGLVWALVVAGVAVLWFKDLRIGAIIAAAMIINLIAAALSGVLIPLVLRRFGSDPALSGAVVLTTVTDIVGFAVFLGLGTLVLL